MNNKQKTKIIIAAVAAILIFSVAIGVKLSYAPTLGAATAEQMASDLQARGAAKGSTPADLAKFLVTPSK